MWLGECQLASRGALSDVTVLIEGVVGGGDESAAWVRLRHAHVVDFQLDVEPVAGTGRGGPGEVIEAPMIPVANGRPVVTSSRMVMAAVCQPLAASPLKKVSRADSSPRWNG